jgi:hypothetical protein
MNYQSEAPAGDHLTGDQEKGVFFKSHELGEKPNKNTSDISNAGGSLLSSALLLLKSGVSVIPVDPETKTPPTGFLWKAYQTTLMSELIASKTKWRAMAAICGNVSGNLEVIDFDIYAEWFSPWAELVEQHEPGLICRLLQQKTKNNGKHIFYRCPGIEIPGNEKLASGKIEVVGGGEHEYKGKKYNAHQEIGQWYIYPCYIETKGEGGYFLASPSPGYKVLNGSFLNIPEITPEEREILIRSAIALNKYVKPKKEYRTNINGDRPGDIFNERGDIRPILQKHGWIEARGRGDYDHWTRPGKDRGISASLIDRKIFYIFTTNAPPFEEKTAYAPFSVYTLLEHGGDFEAAARELKKEGYSSDQSESRKGADWEEPVPLDIHQLPTMPDNLLPGSVGEMARSVSEFTETPYELAAGMALATVSASIAGKYEIEIKHGYSEPLNEYFAVALEPGNRKTAVVEAMTIPIVRWEAIQAENIRLEIIRRSSTNKAIESRINRLNQDYAKAKDDFTRKDILDEIQSIKMGLEPELYPPRIFTQDVTPEQLGVLMVQQGGRMAIISDEGGVFDTFNGRYSKNGGPNLDLLLKGHSGSPVRVDRRSSDPVYINKPAITLGLSPQPETLVKIGNMPEFRGRGVLARIKYLLPNSPLGFRKLSGPPIPARIVVDYEKFINTLLDIPTPKDDYPPKIKLAASAFREWNDFAHFVETEMRPGGGYEFIKDWAGKLPGAAARLAGLIHIMDMGGSEISLETMNNALDLASVFVGHALVVFDMMGADESLNVARRIWGWVEREHEKSFTKREAFNALKGVFHNMEKMEPGFKVLEERNYIAITKQNTGGRPSCLCDVNPSITKGWI